MDGDIEGDENISWEEARDIMEQANEKYEPKCEDGRIPGRAYTDKTMRTMELLYVNKRQGRSQVEKIAEKLVKLANEDSESNCFKMPDKNKKCEEDDDDGCEGVVAVCTPKSGLLNSAPNPNDDQPDPSTEVVAGIQDEVNQVYSYIGGANKMVAARGGKLTRSGTPQPPGAGRAAARAERRANPDKYVGLVVGHAPDATWGNSNVSIDWVPMTVPVNSAIGWQNTQYPVGYRATEFVMGQWTASGQCVPTLADERGTYGLDRING